MALFVYRSSVAVTVFSVALILLLCSSGDARNIGITRNGRGCTTDDIVLYQAATEPLPSGIPTYTVNILNLCSNNCVAMSNIHVSCGSFSSARLINPKIFRRLVMDDCLLNDGRPLRSGSSTSFQYANTFMNPLAISSATCSF